MENEDKLFEELWLSTNKITYMNAYIYLETEIHIHNMDLPNTPLLKGGGVDFCVFFQAEFQLSPEIEWHPFQAQQGSLHGW